MEMRRIRPSSEVGKTIVGRPALLIDLRWTDGVFAKGERMDKKEESGDVIHANISGPVSGQIAVGKEITQTQTIGERPQVTEADLAELRKMLAELKAKVGAEAPIETKDAALERVDELEEAITAKEPDL